VRVLAAVTALRRLAGARRRLAPLAPAGAGAATSSTITVVVPARDEEHRIRPLLEVLRRAPGVHEVLVVDDESTDATAAVARELGATVVRGRPLPPWWAGKAWALQQGLERATGDWVVALDADTRPSPLLPLALVSRAERDGWDLVSVGGRFECPTRGAAWLHPAMLTTLVYRFGPSGRDAGDAPGRALANGQCLAARRADLVAAGGLAAVGHQVVEDVALARHLATGGRRVAMLDGASLLTTRMFDDLRSTWRGWGRSLALPGVEPFARQIGGLVVVALAQAAPTVRLLARRADAVDLVLLAARAGTLVGTAGAYERRRPAYWSSPLADVVALAALGLGTARRRGHRWRGRRYP